MIRLLFLLLVALAGPARAQTLPYQVSDPGLQQNLEFILQQCAKNTNSINNLNIPATISLATTTIFTTNMTFASSVTFNGPVAGLYNSSAQYLTGTSSTAITGTAGNPWIFWPQVSTRTVAFHGNTYACMSFNCEVTGTAAAYASIGFWVDGTYADTESLTIGACTFDATASSYHTRCEYKTQSPPTAASHTFRPMFLMTNGNSFSLNARQKEVCWFEVHECP